MNKKRRLLLVILVIALCTDVYGSNGFREKGSHKLYNPFDSTDRYSDYSLNIAPGVLLPFGIFGEMAQAGYGSTLSFNAKKLLPLGIESLCELGYYYMPGRSLGFMDDNTINNIHLGFLLIKAVYRFSLGWFSIMPAISTGILYMNVPYTCWDPDEDEYIADTKHVVDPAVEGGLVAEINFPGSLSAGVFASYGVIIEIGSIMTYIRTGLIFGCRLAL